MANFWDFVGGASNYLLDERRSKAQDSRDMEKAKALEALRRETSDYEYGRGKSDDRKVVDPKLSYLDPATKQYVMVNSEGTEVGRRDATGSELRSEQIDKLKIEDMQTDIAYKKKLTANVGVSGSGGGRRSGLDSADGADTDKKLGKLHSLANTVIGNLRKYNLPEDFIAKAEATLRSKINSGQATEAWIRNFESSYLGNKNVSSSLRAASDARAARDIFGNTSSD